VNDQKQLDWKAMREKTGPYPPEAYLFVREGLAHTVRMTFGEHATRRGINETAPENEHVTGQQLCLGLRDYAVDQYGLLAKTVLARWSIRTTEDFGKIVFAMIDAGLMRKSDEDSLADFQNIYEFDEAFDGVSLS
jgi:uncharacterized repeat protein (TIGR04138 family)